jgi:hypothetical protein
MYVYNWKYGILKKDIDLIISSWKIPIFILWWKEILKLEKKWNKNLLVFNITYPSEMNWDLNEKTTNIIKQERFAWRWWNEKSKENNIIWIKKYMNLFFNHPTFKKIFYKTHTTLVDDDSIFIKDFWELIKWIIKNKNILNE